MAINDKEMTAGPGDAIFLYPDASHYISTREEGCSFVLIHFDFSMGENNRILDEFEMMGMIPKCVMQPESGAVCDWVSSNEGAPLFLFTMQGYLYILLAKMFRYFQDNPGRSFSVSENAKNIKKLWPVIDYIAEHVSGRIDNKALASAAGASLSYFNTLFKKTLGLTPGQYVHQLRMRLAKTYILEGNYTSKQIAYMLGFADQYSFSKAFKRYYKVPPSKFMK